MKKLLGFGPLFIIIASLLWSYDGILRRGLYSLPPSIIVFYEHVVGFAILLFLIPKWWPDLKKMTKKEWLAMGAVSLFASTLGTIFYTAALGQVNYIQYSVVLLLQQLQPLWAIGMAALLLKEKITKSFILWAAVALVAAYFITFKDLTVNLQTGAGTLYAGLLALGAGAVWGSSTAVSKVVLNKVSFLTATALRFAIAPFFAFGFIVSFGQTAALYQITSAQWTSLLIIAFSTGMVGLAIYYFGLKKTPARIATICELVWPASAVFIDYFYFKNSLSLTQILGVIVLLFSIYQVAWKNK